MAQGPYLPRGASAKLFDCRSGEVCIHGPAGTGKTRSCLERAYLAGEKYPNSRILFIRKTRASLTDSVLVTFESHVLHPGHPLLVDSVTRRGRHSYKFINGSEIVVAGIDNPAVYGSSEWDMVIAFEATQLTLGDWETLTGRNRNHVIPYQQCIADCNPGPPTHWLKKRMDSGDMANLPSRHQDNPVYYDEHGKLTDRGKAYIEGKLDKLTGIRHKRLRLGLWAAAEGIVYEEWDDTIHMCDSFEIPYGWAHYRVIDFGYNNPFVCQWWAIDGDNHAYMYREIYWSQRIVSDHAADIKRLTGKQKIIATICDHDAEDRATLEACGIPTIAAKKSKELGFEAVRQGLRKGADKKPAIALVRDALVARDPKLVELGVPCQTSEEPEGYVYPDSTRGQPKEDPIPRDDHGMDCLRYFRMHLTSRRPSVGGGRDVL